MCIGTEIATYPEKPNPINPAKLTLLKLIQSENHLPRVSGICTTGKNSILNYFQARIKDSSRKAPPVKDSRSSLLVLLKDID